jgi:hypothetical protein
MSPVAICGTGASIDAFKPDVDYVALELDSRHYFTGNLNLSQDGRNRLCGATSPEGLRYGAWRLAQTPPDPCAPLSRPSTEP